MPEMYPNLTRIMICTNCSRELIVPTPNKTKAEVREMMRTFICHMCRKAGFKCQS